MRLVRRAGRCVPHLSRFAGNFDRRFDVIRHLRVVDHQRCREVLPDGVFNPALARYGFTPRQKPQPGAADAPAPAEPPANPA